MLYQDRRRWRRPARAAADAFEEIFNGLLTDDVLQLGCQIDLAPAECHGIILMYRIDAFEAAKR